MLVSRIRFLLLALVSLFVLDRAPPLIGAGRQDPITAADAIAATARLPIRFEPNQGQFADTVRFVAHKAASTIVLTDKGATLAVRGVRKSASSPRPGAKPATEAPVVVGLRVADGRQVAPRGSDELVTKTNYYLGKDPAKWRTNVPTYGRVEYPSVRDGVDLVYHSENGSLEYDFVVAPGVDATNLAMNVEGANELTLTEAGDLAIHTPAGDILQRRPVVYQRTDHGDKQIVASSYRILGRSQVGFTVAAYDRARTLVIDPGIGFATFLGGGSTDFAGGVAADGAGNTYVAGLTVSTDFLGTDPGTINLGQETEGTPEDAYVTKLNATGSGVVYSTYLGGSSNDGAQGIAVDNGNQAYVTGWTSSSDFPMLNPVAGNDTFITSNEVFVTRLNVDGALGYSTYIAGSADEQGRGVAVDGNQNAYVTGWTTSIDFAATSRVVDVIGPIDGPPIALPPVDVAFPAYRAFVVKMHTDGSSFDYTNYLPGNNVTESVGIALDSSQRAYITGLTEASDFPATPACPDKSNLPGDNNVFVARSNAAGDAWEYTRCIGGSDGSDTGSSIAVDSANNAYVTGSTSSSDFPTAGVPIPKGADSNDAIVFKLDPTGANFVFSTYLGGASQDTGAGIAVDATGAVWVIGTTSSNDFPTKNAFMAFHAGGCKRVGSSVSPQGFPCGTDVFVSRLNATGSALTFSTYYGGQDADLGASIALTTSSVHITGDTFSTDLLTLPNPGVVQPDLAAGLDTFVAKLSTAPLLISPPNASVTTGQSVAFGATGGAGFGYVFTLTTNHSGGSISPDGSYAAGNTGGGNDVVTVTDAAGLTATATVAVSGGTVASDLIITPPNTSTTPKGQRVFTASGGAPPYTFAFASNASGGIMTAGGTYTAGTTGGVTDIVRVTDAVGSTRTATVSVGPAITITPTKPTSPPGGTVNFLASGGSGSGYSWTISTNKSAGTIDAATGHYVAGAGSSTVDTVKVTDSLGNSATVQVSVGGGLAVAPDDPTTTTKGTINFNAFGGSGVYTWSMSTSVSGGAVDPITGVYTAGTTGNVVDVVKVTDSVGKSAAVQVHVGPSLTITPSTSTVLTGAGVSFVAAGGSGTGYVYTIPTNQSGAAVDANGAYTAGGDAGVDTVNLGDSLGNTANASVTVTARPNPGNGADGGPGTTSGGVDAGGFNGLNLAGGGNDDCNCTTVGSASHDATTPRMLAGLALALGLVLRRRRR